MKFQLTTTVDVAWCEESPEMTPKLQEKVRIAVEEALGNMFADAQGMGFNHSMASEISILLDSPLVIKPA